MRKIILLAVAAFIWKKVQARIVAPTSPRSLDIRS